jgi:hypothetical protein
MPDSDFVFDRGTPIDIGFHGETDYVFHQSEPVPNAGRSIFIKESGIGIGGGGAFDWYTYTDGHPNASISLDTGFEEVLVEHDGSEDGRWVGAYSQSTFQDNRWEITFRNVNGTQNEIENNIGLGVISGTPPNPRPMLDPQEHSYIGYHYDEQYIDSGESSSGHALVTSDGTADSQNGDNVVRVREIDFTDSDFTVGFDNGEAYLLLDDEEIARTSEQVNNTSYRVSISMEDDSDTTVEDSVSVGAVLSTGLSN